MKSQGSHIIQARGIIPIYYSTVSNTSKKISYMLQSKMEQQKFIAPVTNIGNISSDDFLELKGPIIFIMSTYGNGGSPPDGEQFVQWLSASQKKYNFDQLQFTIMGLGNRTFQHFCGNSVKIREILVNNGAKQLLQFVKCDSSSNGQTAEAKFPEWSNNLIKLLKQKFQVRSINAQDLFQDYKAILSEIQLKDQSWQKQRQVWQPKLGKQFLTYDSFFRSEVIYIKQMRKKDDGRSTLWVRLKIPQGFKLEVACNISIYPQNVRNNQQEPYKGSVTIQTKKKNPKLPFPPMPLQKLWKISNLNQQCDANTLKYAITISQAGEQTKQKYSNLLKNLEQYQKNPIRCYQVFSELKTGVDFLIKLGINTVRPYTLASWEPEKGYFDLIASIHPLGLTSRYLKSNPQFLKINLTTSSFYVTEGRPIVMIANGTGIAPFRSLTQYYTSNATNKVELYLYFGIQNKQVDYYYDEEWQNLQKQGKIKLRIAESRTQGKKTYIQDLIKEDKEFFTKHLFENNGLIFICGGSQMAKAVDTQIFQAIKVKQPVPFKAFKLSKQLQKNKTIVKQVYH